MQLLPKAPVASCADWKYVSRVVFTAPFTGNAPPQSCGYMPRFAGALNCPGFAGHCVITGLEPESVLSTVDLVTTDRVDQRRSPMPEAYAPLDVSGKVARIVVGMTKLVDQLVWGDPAKKFV